MVGCVESKEQYELNDEENDPTTTYHVILRKTSPTGLPATATVSVASVASSNWNRSNSSVVLKNLP